jgi:hypothetical protein
MAWWRLPATTGQPGGIPIDEVLHRKLRPAPIGLVHQPLRDRERATGSGTDCRGDGKAYASRPVSEPTGSVEADAEPSECLAEKRVIKARVVSDEQAHREEPVQGRGDLFEAGRLSQLC